jgi:protein TonB
MNMSCTDIASVLDSHRMARLAPAERAQIDAHLAACADCTAAWHAQTELAALRVPSVPATLLERALLASRLPQSAPARRARTPIVVASVLLAGAAAAAVTFVSMTRELSAPASSSELETSAAPTALAATLAAPSPQSDATPAPQEDAAVTSVELVELALGVQPIVRSAPAYPPEALQRGIEGHVQLKFDVTAGGIVENVTVVESSDAQFEEPAALALSQWRYLPRIATGKRVGSQGVHTIIRFALNKDPAPVALRTVRPDNDYAGFTRGLEVAMNRLAADDLRGVELQLDEIQALYGADRGDLWNFYGYLYTVQGNYGRAIDAYERSVAIALESPAPGSGPYVALANLYFARHQYDIALKTLLRPQQATSGALPPGGTRRLGAEAEALLERLRALGVTEETL